MNLAFTLDADSISNIGEFKRLPKTGHIYVKNKKLFLTDKPLPNGHSHKHISSVTADQDFDYQGEIDISLFTRVEDTVINMGQNSIYLIFKDGEFAIGHGNKGIWVGYDIVGYIKMSDVKSIEQELILLPGKK